MIRHGAALTFIALSLPSFASQNACAGTGSSIPMPGMPGSSVPSSATPSTSVNSNSSQGVSPAQSSPVPSSSSPVSSTAQSDYSNFMQNSSLPTPGQSSAAPTSSAPNTAAPASTSVQPNAANATSPDLNATTAPTKGATAAPSSGGGSLFHRRIHSKHTVTVPMPTSANPQVDNSISSFFQLPSSPSEGPASPAEHAISVAQRARTNGDVHEHDSALAGISRALYHVFDNVGIPVPYQKGVDLEPSIGAPSANCRISCRSWNGLRLPNHLLRLRRNTKSSRLIPNQNYSKEIPESELEGVNFRHLVMNQNQLHEPVCGCYRNTFSRPQARC